MKKDKIGCKIKRYQEANIQDIKKYQDEEKMTRMNLKMWRESSRQITRQEDAYYRKITK